MIRLPNDSQRITIVGRTGSGKTQAAAFQLSMRSWDVKPWVVYDFKVDELLNEIEGVRHIDVTEVPKRPGIYLVHPAPDDWAGVESQLRRIWEAENIGVYIDEGYMLANPPHPAFRSLLTQGRSKHIPIITLSQRPVWMDRFVFSESEFYQIFALNDARDRQTVQAFIPAETDLNERLPDFHSWYYDVGRDQLNVLKPVPGRDVILDRFAARVAAMGGRRVFI